MNKKILLPIILFASLAVVSAIAFYATFSTTINVTPAILATGQLSTSIEGFTEDPIPGGTFNIENQAETPRTVILASTGSEEIATTYYGNLLLVNKEVDFESNNWQINPTGDVATVKYTLAGSDSFSAEIIEGEKEGYTLIYYKDKSDRFNNPAEVIYINEVAGNLPYDEDSNKEDYDYCAENEYITCHGAKMWYVPTSAITAGELDWGRADEFLFERELIQYNQENEIIIYGGQSLDVYPEFTSSKYLDGSFNMSIEVI